MNTDHTATVPGMGISFAQLVKQQATAGYGKTTVARTVEREMVESPDRPLLSMEEIVGPFKQIGTMTATGFVPLPNPPAAKPLSAVEEAQLAEVMEDPAVRAIIEANEKEAREQEQSFDDDKARHRCGFEDELPPDEDDEEQEDFR